MIDDDDEIIPDTRGLHEAELRGWVIVHEDGKVTITEKGFEILASLHERQKH